MDRLTSRADQEQPRELPHSPAGPELTRYGASRPRGAIRTASRSRSRCRRRCGELVNTLQREATQAVAVRGAVGACGPRFVEAGRIRARLVIAEFRAQVEVLHGRGAAVTCTFLGRL